MKSKLLATIRTTAKTLIVLILMLGSQSINANWKFNSFTRLVHPLVKAPFVAQPPLAQARYSDAVANHVMGSFRQTFLTHNDVDIHTNMACDGCYNRAAIMAASLVRKNKTFDDSVNKYKIKGYAQVWTKGIPYVNGSISFSWQYHVVPVMVYGGEIYVVETLTGHDSGFIKIRDWAATLRPDSHPEKYVFKLVGLDQDPSLNGREKSTYHHTLATLIEEIKSKPAYPDNYLISPEGSNLIDLVDWGSAELYYESGRPPGTLDYYDAVEDDPRLHQILHNRIAEYHPTWSWTQRGWESSCRGG